LKKVCQGLGAQKRLDLGQNLFNIFFSTANRVSPRQQSRGNISSRLGVGIDDFLFISTSVSKTVENQNERLKLATSSSAPFFFSRPTKKQIYRYFFSIIFSLFF